MTPQAPAGDGRRSVGAAGSAAGSGDPEAARRSAERRAVRITAGATDLLRGGRGAARYGRLRTAGSGDPEAARRRAERAVRITAGATKLEQRLTDLLRGGLAGAQPAGCSRQQTAAETT
ncbi:hypothetical protein AB0O75_31995 [Streptomyces sp. NPDC088921]|uniref:hypothetical protein n=1 Tax=unclassified Streptomyces TaxID=2593676 RepID=UPI00342437D3